MDETLCWALQSVIHKFWCSVNTFGSRVRGTGDGCSLENVGSARPPEVGSFAFFNKLLECGVPQ